MMACKAGLHACMSEQRTRSEATDGPEHLLGRDFALIVQDLWAPQVNNDKGVYPRDSKEACRVIQTLARIIEY